MIKEQSKSLSKSSSSQGKEQTSVSSQAEFELEALEEETASILQKFGGRSSRSRSGDYNNVDGSKQLGGSTRCGNATKRHSIRTLKKYSKRRNGSNKRLMHSSSSSSFVTEGGIYHPHAMMAHSSAIKIQSIVRGHLSRRCSTRHDNADNDNHSQHQLNAHHDDAYLSLHEAKRHESKTRLFGNDGRATSHLKNTISNAFKTRRFDSIPAILAHESYGTATTLHEKMADQNEKLDPNYEKYQHSSRMHDSFEYLAFDPRYSATSLLRNDCAAETADIGNHRRAPILINKKRQDDPPLSLSTTQERKSNNNTNTSKRSPKISNHGAEKRLTRKEASGDDINIRDIRYPGSMNCASRSIGNDAGIAGTGIDVYDKNGYDDRGKNKGTSSNNPTTSAPPKAICFNCWSAKRGDTCQLIHQNASTSDTSLSRDNNIKDSNKDAVVPFCESWGLDNVRQMYRSEDIGADHDVDLLLDKPADEAGGNHDEDTKTLVTNSMSRNPHSCTRLSSLRFAKDQRRHSALPEHNFQHPLFASLTKLVMTVNYRARRNLHVRQWFKSLVDCVKNSYFDQQYGEYNMNSQGIAKGYGSREERYWIYHYLERRQGYSNSHIVGIPNATINRYDYYDSISRGMRDRDTRKYSNMVKVFTESIQNELPQPFVTGSLYEDPNADDAEDPGMCYEKKMLESNGKVVLRKFIEPKPIPVPFKLYEPQTRLPPSPVKIEMGRHVDKFEMEDRSTKEASSEKEQENASEIDVITYGTFGKNATPDNLSAGELSSTVILSQTIQTSFDPPYTGFSVIDSKVYSPERTPESFVPTYINDVDAPCLEYIDRPLKHSLDDRGMPTIMIRTADGEDDPRDPKRVNGFRTTEYVDRPKLNSHLDTNKFVPAESIVTLNTPQVLPTTPAWIDVDYPFCETESRDTHIEDLSHIAKFERKFTPNKPQFFTVLSKQHPGKFMKHCDSTQPLGRLETTVTRSWSLTRKRRIAMFHTDDGEPYYYDRRTGKTFWERPLICDEELMPIVEGGVILGDRRNAFIGNDDAFGNPIDARSNMRKMILSQYETEENRIERDRAERSSRPLEGAHSRKQQSSGNAKLGNGTNSACRKFPWRTKLCNKMEGTHENSNPGRKSKHAMQNVSTRTGENDFFEDITARRVGQQFVDYIDSEPQIPRGKPVGRVKPRSAGKDWLAIGFDPWSAGKDLLTIEFIPKLTQSTSQLDDSNHGNDDLFHDSLRSFTDFSGGPPSLSHQRQDKSERKNIAMFDKIARCIRHGNFPEMDTLMNEASWKVPIDYTDDVGNTLLIICCQHGNKRMVKLCLRKGCDMNKQNCNGHTCLHYAFGYGFGKLSAISNL